MIKVYLEDESGHWELLKEFTREIQAASYINKFLDDRNMKHRVVVKEQDEQYVHDPELSSLQFSDAGGHLAVQERRKSRELSQV